MNNYVAWKDLLPRFRTILILGLNAMKKEIMVIVEGDFDALLRVWDLPENVEFERMDDHVELVFNDNDLSEYSNLEAIVERLKLKHSIELMAIFRAYDFTEEDLTQSELLSLHGLSYPWMDIVSNKPIREYYCGTCQQVRFDLQKIDHLDLRSQEIPTGYIISVGTIILFHKKLLELIKQTLNDTSLIIIPSSIKVEGGDIIDDYFWVYSTVDLGLPTGDVEFGVPCSECGRPSCLMEQSFLGAFSREKWHGEDFCTATFFSPDFLYVSQKVFRLINSLPENKKGDISFKPIELI